ncbi:MAG: hypothetical protein U0795_16035 [Pirellulales bacterium]
MQQDEQRQWYRNLTPAQRLQIALELVDQGLPYLQLGTPEQVARKQQRIAQQNDLANRLVLEQLARTKDKQSAHRREPPNDA